MFYHKINVENLHHIFNCSAEQHGYTAYRRNMATNPTNEYNIFVFLQTPCFKNDYKAVCLLNY